MVHMPYKIRLDVFLHEKGLAESRSLAQRLIMAGQVRVDGQMVLKPSAQINPEAAVTVEQGPKYVSRGGEKLEGALVAFDLLDLDGIACADVGASTGGFTDCLLQHGAGKVYSIDVGYGELHWKLRNDPRVVVMERANARFIEKLPEPVQLITIDASFISLRIFWPVIRAWFPPQGGQVVALVKPQFEAGRQDVSRGEGVIRDPAVHRQVLADVLIAAQQSGYAVTGLIRSPLLGPKGNTEFLARLSYPGQPDDLSECIDTVLDHP